MRTKAETTVGVILGVIWGLFVRALLLSAAIYVLVRVRPILVTVMLAVMLTYVMLPAVEFLCGWRVKRWSYKSRRFWASLLVFAVLLGLFGIAIRYVVQPFTDEAMALKSNVGTYMTNLDKTLQRAGRWYEALPKGVTDLFGDTDKQKVKDAVQRWLQRVLKSTVDWAQHVIDIILIPVLAFYFALDYRSLRREFVGALPRARRREALMLLRHVGAILQNYIVGQLILCLIAGVVVGLIVWLLCLSYPLALGVLAGVTRAIPILGPIISGIAIVALGLLRAPIVGLTLLVIFCLMHLVESKFLLPKLMGHQMRLHPAVILIVLLIGGEFFGLFGMFLAVPVAAIIRELVRFYVIAPRSRRETEAEEEQPPVSPPNLNPTLL